VRVGFVGAGAIARRHIDILAGEGGVDVVAVCDPIPERARSAAATCGAAAHADWQPMLAAERLDAVFVCSPPAGHAPPALEALGRGIAVYLEKPLARSLADGHAIVAAWEAGGVCAVGYQWRSLDIVAAARAALGDPAPGLLVSRSLGGTEPARGDLTDAAAGSWFADVRQSGGILFELGSHDIDLQLALAGPVAEVQAAAASGRLALAGREPTPQHDAVSLILRFRGGGLGAVHVGWTAEGSASIYTLDVLAADATLELSLDPAPRLHGRAHGREIDVTDPVDARRRSVQRFLAAAAGADPVAVACTPGDALETLKVALACETAITTGQTVRV
jgi:predicted dehydrogenase